ncbi:class I SAM-dependent methyltransferase [Chroococcus sp. FPU101]|uniref:methyltransferase domain-containing protein n=1 Tax=Chroococcus sp. FPU101 TaxID=1974212 RepID=UPI001A8D54B5|nr:class I SAM-dependent methyltransferase [Chroococcus sp. FPU101]GFE71333.1 hypothetical protein CFPU101_39430 [Chroococcus sp. FPU101]
MDDQQLQKFIASLALEGLVTQISDADQMLARDHAENIPSEQNYFHYFRVTKSALENIERAKDLLAQDIKYILDMPSGHGRVLRGLRWLFPTQTIYACDTNIDGVDFCAENFNAVKVYSSSDLDQVKFPKQFDLIWCGSLITHFNQKMAYDLLKLFINNLATQGILVISSHGDTVIRRMINGETYGLKQNHLYDLINDYYRQGYGYCDYADNSGYGLSLIDKSWFEKMSQQMNFQVLEYRDAAWDNHQDIILIKKV